MQPMERNYEIYNKELLAIIEALTKQRQYLLDAMEPLKIWTDYKNLKYFREPHKLNGRQARWYLKLQNYDFTLQHIPKKTNIKVDILSRKHQVDTQEDNKNVQMLKEELWKRRTIAEIMMLKRNSIIEKMDFLKEIQQNGTRKQKVIQELKKENEQAWENNRIVYVEEQIYTPNNKKIQEQILQEYHDLVKTGHLRQTRML